MQELPITKVKETILKDLGKAEEKVKNCIGNCTQTELAFPVKAYFFSKSNRAIHIQRLKCLLFAFHNTMLQKLSKCEVKAWLCLNLIILPPLRIYLKSNFGKFKQSKNVIFGNFRDSELLILVKMGLEKLLKWTQGVTKSKIHLFRGQNY